MLNRRRNNTVYVIGLDYNRGIVRFIDIYEHEYKIYTESVSKFIKLTYMKQIICINYDLVIDSNLEFNIECDVERQYDYYAIVLLHNAYNEFLILEVDTVNKVKEFKIVDMKNIYEKYKDKFILYGLLNNYNSLKKLQDKLNFNRKYSNDNGDLLKISKYFPGDLVDKIALEQNNVNSINGKFTLAKFIDGDLIYDTRIGVFYINLHDNIEKYSVEININKKLRWTIFQYLPKTKEFVCFDNSIFEYITNDYKNTFVNSIIINDHICDMDDIFNHLEDCSLKDFYFDKNKKRFVIETMFNKVELNEADSYKYLSKMVIGRM